MRDEDIAIVGISVFCAAGESVDEFWHGVSTGGDFIKEAPEDNVESLYFDATSKDIDRFYCNRGGFAKPFKVDPLRYGILPVMADGLDPDMFSSLVGAEHALMDADVFKKKIPLQQCSIIIGKGNFSGLIALRCIEIIRMATQLAEIVGSALPGLTEADLEMVKKAYQSKQGRYQADMAIGTMPNLVASLVANKFDMQGPAYTVDAACASGIVAINHSMNLLRDGQCDIAVAGGMHSGQSAMFWSAFDMMGAISHRGEIAPFSENADGLLIGQGGGFVVLKKLKKAVEDGDRIYAVIKETAVCSDGGGSHVTVTSVQGQKRVLERAWAKSGMDPMKIGLVEAHGTATPVGDKTEIATLTEFFGDKTCPQAFVGSLKSNIGHTMPAAGMMGVIKMALSLYHRTIPPTLHCDVPLSAMYESRFLPPQEAIEWDGKKYPLVGAVNAFGFGGINAHAILTAYEPEKGAPPQPAPKPWLGDAILVSAENKDALIKKLKIGDYTNTGGDYRIGVFDPSEERIEQAISIVEKDKPWRGKLDIWFSNTSLLTKGGKIAFMFPGMNLEQDSETDLLSKILDLPFAADLLAEEEAGEEGSARDARGILIHFAQKLTLSGLEKLGVAADLYMGHSIGEWAATLFAEMTEETRSGSTNDFLDDWTGIEGHPYIAVGGIDRAQAEVWCESIPDLYLANDNCPSQLLFAGTEEAEAAFIEVLKKEGHYHTVLPYGSAHTPFYKDKLSETENFLDDIRVKKGKVPVWSAATLEPIPTDTRAYRELTRTQLVRPVYFRGLTEKLYDEQDVRIFIQIGVGSLVGFVEDTLKDRDFGAVSCNVATRDTGDQMRRVLALLFAEGRDVDSAFVGVKPIYATNHSLMILPVSAPLFTDLPELGEVVKLRYGADMNLGANLSGLSSATGGSTGSGDPFCEMANINMQEAIKSQDELMRLFSGMRSGNVPVQGATSATSASVAEDNVQAATAGAFVAAGNTRTSDAVEADAKNTSLQAAPGDPASQDSTFEETIRLTYEDHPYLIDHSIVRQPAGWPIQKDLNPVVPFTMMIELMAEVAMKRAPGKRISSLSNVLTYKWISVEEPFEGIVKGSFKGQNMMEVELVGYAKAVVNFGDTPSEPPAEYANDIDIGAEIMEVIPSKELYDRYAFHGPQYHSSTTMTSICAKGMTTMAEKMQGKGSLLDLMGQQLGLFLHLTQTDNVISFPVRLGELTFYGDMFDQSGVFEHTLIITQMSDSSIIGDMVLKRDGKAWAIARKFVCSRFGEGRPVWYAIQKPALNKLAEEIAPGVYMHVNKSHGSSQYLLSVRYLNQDEREEYEALEKMKAKREYLGSRIALKDGIRDYVRRGAPEMIYPIQFGCIHDENGKPYAKGFGEAGELVDDLQVSLSHKGDIAVSMVSNNEPVGIDVELIDEKSEGFLALSFTERERKLLEKMKQPEGAIRFWTAKEACAKKTGLGLRGNPKNFEVVKVSGDTIFIGVEKVKTVVVEEAYIVAWTI